MCSAGQQLRGSLSHQSEELSHRVDRHVVVLAPEKRRRLAAAPPKTVAVRTIQGGYQMSGAKAQEPWQRPEEQWRKLVNRVRVGRSLRPNTWKGRSRSTATMRRATGDLLTRCGHRKAPSVGDRPGRIVEAADVAGRTSSAYRLMERYDCSASDSGHKVTRMLKVLGGGL